MFSCLATLSETYSFIPLWHPKFISKLATEDRRHLNGLALDGTDKNRRTLQHLLRSYTRVGERGRGRVAVQSLTIRGPISTVGYSDGTCRS